MEWTPHCSPRASSDTVSCSFSYHTWQFIIFTIFTITACIISYSLRISFWTQDFALQQILSSIDLFLFYRTDYTDSRTMLNGCTGKCVRPSRPLVGFLNHCIFISFHFSFVRDITKNIFVFFSGHTVDSFDFCCVGFWVLWRAVVEPLSLHMLQTSFCRHGIQRHISICYAYHLQVSSAFTLKWCIHLLIVDNLTACILQLLWCLRCDCA